MRTKPEGKSRATKLDDEPVDRRAVARHGVSAEVRVEAQEGFVRDLSTRGLYFVAPADVRVGSLVEIEISLPHTSPSRSVECRVTARVTRVEHLGESMGVAAEIEGWRMPEPDADC